MWHSCRNIVNVIHAHSCHWHSCSRHFLKICLSVPIKITCWGCCVGASWNCHSPCNFKKYQMTLFYLDLSKRLLVNSLVVLQSEQSCRSCQVLQGNKDLVRHWSMTSILWIPDTHDEVQVYLPHIHHNVGLQSVQHLQKQSGTWSGNLSGWFSL